jgi:hypothetical protein
MHFHKNTLRPSLAAQGGTTLIVVLILILLATVLALFAVKVNLSEQRASGNDVKTRLMRQSAEAALSQGMAYLQSLKTTEKDPFATNSPWKQCNAGDVDFPCGTVPVDDGATPTAHARRANMFYYTGSTVDINGDGSVDAMEARMLPMTNRMTELTTTGNGFTVQYGAGVLLCVLKKPDPAAANPPVECATTSTDASGTIAFTVVGVGSMPNEAGHTTLTQSVGSYVRVNNPPGAPPIVASGSANLVGTFQVVTNPNAAGTGVPITIWTRGNVDKHGTANSCYYDEFIRDGQGGSAGAVLEPALNTSLSSGLVVTPADQIMRCDQCSCQGSDSLSFQKSGGAGQLGIDILQCSTGPGTPCSGNNLNDPTNPTSSNYEIKPNEFPCDLFQYVFGTAGHKDVDGDYFCEHQITVSAKVADGTFTLPADEAYLYAAADKIIPANATNSAHVQATQLGTCAQLNSASASGLWWDQTGACTLTGTACIGSQGGKGNLSSCVGSISFPLLLVGDDNITIKNSAVFGFMFVRATGSKDLDPTTGGNATSSFAMNGKGALYGALVVQGTVQKITGNAAIIYNDKVLKNLVNNSLPPAFASIPGGWSDRFSY